MNDKLFYSPTSHLMLTTIEATGVGSGGEGEEGRGEGGGQRLKKCHSPWCSRWGM